MKAFVTGGTGFVGGMLVRKLCEAGYQVRALVRPGADTRQLEGLPVERVQGDLRDLDSLVDGAAGCQLVFHVAALYSFWGHSDEEFYQVNVTGTRNTLEAARQAGVERVIYTSSIATLAFHEDRSPVDESEPSSLGDMITPYKRTKYLAEDAAREYAAAGLPVVILNPSSPVGVGDHKPTATGQVVVDFLNGRMFGYVDTGMNIVDVEDVALGHMLAVERGEVGERYILGGENLTLKQVLDLLSQVSGLPEVRLRIPHGVALAWSYIDTGLARLNPKLVPAATPDKVRQSRRYEFYDTGKAIRELGYPQSSAREALRKSVEWYRANGYAA
jgi:dihydroflavonol-4-reductase